MALIQKINPIGIDVVIDDFQSFLFAELGFAEYESYPRIYLNPKAKKRVPEHYTGNGDYEEVYYNDKFDISSFFFAEENRAISNEGITEVEVSLIVQADIMKLYPTILHRADEELNNAIYNASGNYVNSRNFRITSIVTGVDNVYKEFDREQMRLDNMSNQYVVRFNYGVRYQSEC